MGSEAVDHAEGLLAGAVPYGMPPMRGSRELMIATKRDPWMYACTRKIADSFAAVPWRLYVARDKGKPSKAKAKAFRREYQRMMAIQISSPGEARARTRAIGDLRADMDVEEVADHPFLDLLDTANPAMTGQAANQITQIYTETQGEAFWIFERNAAGMPVEIWPIPPFWVYRTPFRGQPYYHVIFGTYQAHIPETDMVWMKILDAENPYSRGQGAGMALADEIDTEEYASKTLKAFFYNGAVPPYIVAMEGASRETLLQSKENFERDTRGFWNAMRAHWTSAKNLIVKEMSPKFTDMQLVELRRFLRDTKIQTYGIPPEILGIIEHSNRSTIETAMFIFAEQVLRPRLEFRRSYYQTRILPEYDESLIAMYDSPTPDDREFRMKVFGAAPWAFKVDEFREMADAEPLGGEEGDERPPMPSTGPAVAEKPVSPGAPGKAARKSDDEEIYNVLDALRPEYITAEIDPVFRERLESWANDALDSTGANVNPQLLNPLIRRHLEQLAGDRIDDMVNDTTLGELRAALSEGVKAGEGIEALAERVGEVFDRAEGYRAERIARTEVLRSSNFASTAAYKISGLVHSREWVSTQDDRVRDTHDDMDGQQVGIDEPFTSPSGASGMYPGDLGDPAEDINCRCTTAPIIEDVDDEEEDQSASVGAFRTKEDRVEFWKRYDAKVAPWEKAALRALKRGFKAQRAAVLHALRKKFGKAAAPATLRAC